MRIDLNAEPRPEPRPRSWKSDGGLIHKANPAIAELAQRAQWVLWKGKLKPNGRIEKIPYCVGGRKKARSTDPRTWDTFDACWTSAFVDGRADGIGYVFSEHDPFCGVDLDECRDPVTGELTEEVLFWLQYLDSYAEVSPSRTGVKLICQAKLPGKGRKVGGLEIYDRGRFFAITGDHLDGTNEEISEAQEAAEAVLAEVASRSKGAGASRHAGNGPADRADLGRDDDPLWHTCTDEIRAKLETLLTGHPGGDLAQCLDLTGDPPDDASRSGWMARLARLLRERLGVEADEIAAGLVFMCERHGWDDKLGREVKRAVELVMADDEPAEAPVDQLPPKPPSIPAYDPLPWEEPTDRPMFHGPLGDVVRRLDPDTEADPKAVMLCLLTCAGNWLGRRYYARLGADRHFPTIHALLLGDSALGRKGTAANLALRTFEAVDPDWHEHNVRRSINSGEGIAHVVKTIDERAKERAEQRTGMTNPSGGRRALFILEEFGETLRKAGSQGSTILPYLRRVWDGGILENNSLTNPLRVSKASVGLIGMITGAELVELMDPRQLATGSLNRFTMLDVHRTKKLRKPPVIDVAAMVDGLADEIRHNALYAGMRNMPRTEGLEVPMILAPDAEDLMADIKDALEGAMEAETWLAAGKARAYVQALRLALIYAVMDGAPAIEVPHVVAARDLVGLSTATMENASTAELGDPIAERIITGLNEAPGQALTRAEISSMIFTRNCTAKELERAIGTLLKMGMVRVEIVPTQGRSKTVIGLTSQGLRP